MCIKVSATGCIFIDDLRQQIYQYKNSTVSYYRYGRGKEVIIAFHGYNQTGADFAPIAEVLQHKYTFIAIDFFWHGKSEWQEPHNVTETDLRELVLAIIAQEQQLTKKITVYGFSMGARMARVLVQTIPESIERLILLSPPTIEFNQLVNFTTGTLLGSLVFKYVATNHSMLVVWLQRLHRWKILNRSVYLYSSKNIGEKQRMTKVYKTWTAQRMLRTNLAQIARLANKHKIELILIAGKNDALAPPYKMIKYIRNLFQKHKVFLVRKKHELVTPETIHLLRRLLIDS